jgi:hypothetical protein
VTIRTQARVDRADVGVEDEHAAHARADVLQRRGVRISNRQRK